MKLENILTRIRFVAIGKEYRIATEHGLFFAEPNFMLDQSRINPLSRDSEVMLTVLNGNVISYQNMTEGGIAHV